MRRRRASERRWPYLPSLVLLLAGIGLGVFAILLLPSGSSGPVPGQFSVVLSVPPEALTNLDIYEHREAGDTVLQITAFMPNYPGTQYFDDTTVYLYYPAGNRAHCEQAYEICDNQTRNGLIVFTLKQVNGAAEGYPVEVSRTVFFSGPPLGAYNDDNAATAQLPQVQLPIEIGQDQQQQLTEAVRVRYTLANASTYVWTTGEGPISAARGVMTWNLSPVPQGSTYRHGQNYTTAASTATAVNQAAQQHGQFLTFLAGALVGVAGGALLAAGQEFLDAREGAKKRLRNELADSDSS